MKTAEPIIKDWDELTNEERAALDAACTPAHIANQHLLTGLCSDIKKGDKFHIQVEVESVADDYAWCTHPDNMYNEYSNIAVYYKDLIPIPDPPKYDPCRKFRQGDNVSPCFWNDRPPTAYDINEITAHFMPEDGLYTVNKDEFPDSTVLVEYKGKIISMQACHLELMTPVEELEPYSIGESDYKGFVNIEKNGKIIAMLPYGKELHEYKTEAEAREAAEAECARLNEEFREKRLDVLKRQNEEPESYGLSSHTDGKCVDWHVTEKDGFICASFHARPHGAYTPSAAREAAQTERDRLNEQYRKGNA